jgi:hypothetical protein
LHSDQFQIELTPISGASVGWSRSLPVMEPLVGEVTDARRKAKAQEVAERKNVIGETCSIGVVLLDPQIGLMVEQPVENVRASAAALQSIHRFSVANTGVAQTGGTFSLCGGFLRVPNRLLGPAHGRSRRTKSSLPLRQLQPLSPAVLCSFIGIFG